MLSIVSEKTPLFLAVLLSAAVTLPATGANLRWLDHSPARFFTDTDWQMLSAKSDEALNKGEDGQEYSWSNPDTGSSGSFVAGPAEDRKGLSCRLMTIVTEARTASNTSQFTFCRQENGEWKITR
jgi:surface antigen